MKRNNQNLVIPTIAVLVTIIGTVFAVSSQFVSNASFREFKEGTIGGIYQRLDSIDKKLDQIINTAEK